MKCLECSSTPLCCSCLTPLYQSDCASFSKLFEIPYFSSIFQTACCENAEIFCLYCLRFSNHTSACSSWYDKCFGQRIGELLQSCLKSIYCLPRTWSIVWLNIVSSPGKTGFANNGSNELRNCRVRPEISSNRVVEIKSARNRSMRVAPSNDGGGRQSKYLVEEDKEGFSGTGRDCGELRKDKSIEPDINNETNLESMSHEKM